MHASLSAPMCQSVSVYVPSTVDVSNLADCELVESITRHVKLSLASMFGGYTATVAEGGWIDDDGNLIEEPVRVITSFTTPEALAEHEDKVVALVEYVRVEMSQACVSLVINNQLHLV